MAAYCASASAALAIVLVLVLVLAAPLTSANQQPMVFTHLSTADGLSQVTVNDILQDSLGFIWLATENGLNRYDGNEIKHYYRERGNADGLASDYFWSLAQDQAGNIWLATEGGGLVVWNVQTESFKSYRHTPGDSHTIAGDSVVQAIVDRKGRVWAAIRDKGLDRLDPVTGEITHFVHDSAKSDSLSSNYNVYSLLEDENGSIWVSTGAGLDRYRGDGKGFEHFQPPAVVGGIHKILDLVQDSYGDLWLGSFDAGLQRLDLTTGKFTRYTHNPHDPTSLGSDDVRTIFEDSANRLWVGTAAGLDLFSRSDNTFQTYVHDRAKPGSLGDSFVVALTEDQNGLLWVGTKNAGASRWNPRSWSLGHRLPTWLVDQSEIAAFADAPDGGLWVGTMGHGLLHTNAAGQRTHTATNLVLGDLRVMSLLNDSEGQLWIGTMSAGLCRLDADGSLKSFRADGTGGLGSDGIMSLYEGESGLIWIGTYEGGVSVYDPETGEIHRYTDTTGSSPWFERTRATAVREDHQGRIWVATDGDGLLLLDPENGLRHRFLHDSKQPSSLASNALYALYVDRGGTLWIGTGGGGLDHVVDMTVQLTDFRFENVSQANGLSNNVINGIQADSSGLLWLPSNNGLIRFDPQTKLIRTFHASHGAQGGEYTAGAAFQTATGRLLFAGTEGYNDFDPRQVAVSEVTPPVVITRIDVDHKPLNSRVAVALLDRLALGYQDNALSLEFAALEFTDPQRNQYTYQLLGFDEGWVPLGNKHNVSYTNLEAGSYVFSVKGASAGSVWNEQGARLLITVESAPWRTWWAYSLYAALFVLVLVALYRGQSRRLREQERYAARLAKEVTIRTAQLNQRNEELADASAAKSNFLARMSHEIRTPMNGVMGMTELLSLTDLQPRQRDYTQTIARSGAALLQIINTILDLSKIEAGRVELESVPFDFESMIDDCFALLSPHANDKGLELVAILDPELPRAFIGDELRTRQVLTNLLSNALKFTAEGEVILRVLFKSSSAQRPVVRLEVTDTGIGIDESAQARVFDAFSQADESTTRRFGGTGLGLSICKQLTELMGGTIGVTSQLNVGSTFWCEFPLKVRDAQCLGDPGSGLRGLRFLLAIESLALQESISGRLLADGAAAVATHSSATVEQLLASGAVYDVLVLDADGGAVCAEQIRHMPWPEQSWIVRIILSRRPAGRHDEDGHGRQRDMWLAKPVAFKKLRQAVVSALAQPVARSVGQVDGSATDLPATKGRVLVAEDNPVNQLVAQGMLIQLGYQARLVADGQAAIELLSTEHFDLVMMDCQMPYLDGFDTARRIRKSEQGEQPIPIIGVTAHAFAEAREACLQAGMNDFLSKPYTLDGLNVILMRWCRKNN